MRLALTIVVLVAVAGCASGRIVITPPSKAAAESNLRVIAKPRDQVWNAAVPALGKQFFVINNLDKSSGLINISYSGTPERYIDCGQITSEVGGRTYSFAGASARQDYELLRDGRPLNVNRRMSLEGRMNVIFEDLGPNKTMVSATTRYVVTRLIQVSSGSIFVPPMTDTLSFNSGQGATFPEAEHRYETECLARGTLEAEVLSLIERAAR